MDNPSFNIGDVLDGRYRLGDVLFESVQAIVYVATQVSTGQEVVVKTMKATAKGMVDGRKVERFKREMALVAKLNHRSIVRLVDRGELGGILYMVLEHVEGLTLAQYIKQRGAPPLRTAVHVMYQVLEAIAFAHRNGIVHRDLKPSNIMFDPDVLRPTVKVLDFGIAGVMEDAREFGYKPITAAEDFFGTPAYMSPGQIQRVTDVVPAMDIYSWGLVFAEAITGRAVVSGATLIDIAMVHISSGPHTLSDSIPDTLRELIASAIRKEGDLPDADELLDRLDEMTLPGDSRAAEELAMFAATTPMNFTDEEMEVILAARPEVVTDSLPAANPAETQSNKPLVEQPEEGKTSSPKLSIPPPKLQFGAGDRAQRQTTKLAALHDDDDDDDDLRDHRQSGRMGALLAAILVIAALVAVIALL